MDNVKNILLSRTIQGIILMAIGKYVQIDSVTYNEVITNAMNAVTAIGAIWAVYGRIKAEKKLKMF